MARENWSNFVLKEVPSQEMLESLIDGLCDTRSGVTAAVDAGQGKIVGTVKEQRSFRFKRMPDEIKIEDFLNGLIGGPITVIVNTDKRILQRTGRIINGRSYQKGRSLWTGPSET